MTAGHEVSRRTLLGAVGLGLLGGTGVLAGCGRGGSSAAAPVRRATVAEWVATRGPRHHVAHRGSGDVLPEHSMPAYQAAVDWGARCMEVSVTVTSDGRLVCMHDLTYDRTTTGRGAIAAQPASVLQDVGLWAPQLGPAWEQQPLPRVPFLEEVLTAFGGEVVLCLEAKDDAAYPPMMEMVEDRGLKDSVVVKAYRTSGRIEQAQQAGYPVFAYLAPTDLTPETIAETAARLRPERDYLVVPVEPGDGSFFLPDDVVRDCLSHGVPVWVYAVHRRVVADHYVALGVSGIVSSSFGYLAGTLPVAVHDEWAGKRVVPGEMSLRPGDPALAPVWTGTDELTLAQPGRQQFLTLGQLAPVAAPDGRYRVEFSARWTQLPRDLSSNLTIAFGHTDDRYYQHRLGVSDGYHAIMCPDGRFELYAHRIGQEDGRKLAAARTQPAVEGAWMDFRLEVGPQDITWTRTDPRGPQRVQALDPTVRGGYLHIGRSAADDRAQLSFRGLTVTRSPVR